MTVNMQRTLMSVAALAAFTLAGVLRSADAVNPYVITAIMLLGVVLGGRVAYSIIKARR